MKLGWFGLGMGAFADPEGVADLAAAAEAFGYESVWLGEHPVLLDPQQRPSPLPPHSELLDPIAVLAYAAARTSRVRLGTGIVLLPLRNPVTLAKELASVDVLSRGRLSLGIGVGYVKGEYDALGVDFKTRGRRADESIDALRILWNEERPEMHGAFVDFASIQCMPRPVQPGGPPIFGSGMSTAARRRTVGRCNGYYGFLLDLDATRGGRARIVPPGRRSRAPRRSGSARDHDHTTVRAIRLRYGRALRGPWCSQTGARARLSAPCWET